MEKSKEWQKPDALINYIFEVFNSSKSIYEWYKVIDWIEFHQFQWRAQLSSGQTVQGYFDSFLPMCENCKAYDAMKPYDLRCDLCVADIDKCTKFAPKSAIKRINYDYRENAAHN